MIDLRDIRKDFGGVRALRGVSLSIDAGECRGLVGENGAGKSTLGRIIAGIHRPDAGEIRFDGAAVEFRRPSDALRRGVAMVHQELAFCPALSVWENLHLGRYVRRMGLLVSRRRMREQAQRMLSPICPDLDIDLPMRALSTAQEQLVQIAAAIAAGSRVIVLDEPTSSLSQQDADRLLALVRRLRESGITLIYVSHRLPEVLAVCDRISVLRDGELVRTVSAAETDQTALVRLMIGRDIVSPSWRHLAMQPGAPALEVSGLASPGRFTEVSFTLRAGEIVGLAGLVGAGRSEVAAAIFGLDARRTGQVRIHGREVPAGRVSAARAAGLALLPEDRKRQGLVLGMSCAANLALASLDRLSRWGFLRLGRQRSLADALFDRVGVRGGQVHTAVQALSGGNQQKIVLGKWLAVEPTVFIVDEPTRGVDVGARESIHALLDDLAANGAAILLISSDLPEVLSLSRRVLVMRRGRLAGELPRQQASEEAVMRLMAHG